VTDPTDRAPAPPTKLAQQFVRYFGGFAVGVGLALVPALPLSVRPAATETARVGIVLTEFAP